MFDCVKANLQGESAVKVRIGMKLKVLEDIFYSDAESTRDKPEKKKQA